MYSVEEKPDFTLKEAAKILNITYLGLYTLAKKGRIPAYRLGSQWRVNRNELERFRRGEYNPIKIKSGEANIWPLKNEENIIQLDFHSKVKKYEDRLAQHPKRKH